MPIAVTMKWHAKLFILAALLAVLVAAWYFQTCWIANTGPSLRVLATAHDRRVTVVSARHLANCRGYPARNLNQPWWYVNAVPDDASPTTQLYGTLANKPRVIVIFVHGYNTVPDVALQDGFGLDALIDRADHRLETTGTNGMPSGSIAFVTFLWRGDFSQWRFSASQHAAEITAHALVDFLTTLRHELPQSKIVVIAHSLGAYLVLEALKEFDESYPSGVFLDSLALVQGAVPAYSLYKWTVTGGTIPDFDKPIYRNLCVGRYVEHTRAVRQLVYTYSERDDVLTNIRHKFILPSAGFFAIAQKWNALPEECELPWYPAKSVDLIPLGIPFETVSRLAFVPMPRPKVPQQQNRSRESYVVPIQLAQLGDQWFRYDDWSMDSSIQALKLPLDSQSKVLESWHSPIFDATNAIDAQIVESIWTRVRSIL
jgi:pimeloyl-ACP methyl ester carboxylesterase